MILEAVDNIALLELLKEHYRLIGLDETILKFFKDPLMPEQPGKCEPTEEHTFSLGCEMETGGQT